MRTLCREEVRRFSCSRRTGMRSFCEPSGSTSTLLKLRESRMRRKTAFSSRKLRWYSTPFTDTAAIWSPTPPALGCSQKMYGSLRSKMVSSLSSSNGVLSWQSTPARTTR